MMSLTDLRSRMRAAHLHRITIEATERVLEAEHEFLEQKIPAPVRLWQGVVMLLVARALQLQRSILDTVTIGYDEEVEPGARACHQKRPTERIIRGRDRIASSSAWTTIRSRSGVGADRRGNT